MSQDDHFTKLNISESLAALADLDDINYPLDTKEDIENPIPPASSLLMEERSCRGMYYFFALDGSAQKYDANVIGNKIRTKLNKLEDFPRC